ncbi:MAG: hypothetical protein U0703_05550 [Anaerolineae bacterium]
MNRDQAWQIVTEFVQSDSLRKHMLSVEYAMRAYAAYYGEDADLVGLVGLLHDWTGKSTRRWSSTRWTARRFSANAAS